MKTEKNIFAAFILNFSFSIFEFIGGIITGSTAILSDSVHDIGDAMSIGVSCILEKKSKKEPDGTYTYGYVRYSALGGLIATLILLLGSAIILCNAIHRLLVPTEISYTGMLVFAAFGTCVNLCAALFTRGGHSLNQKAVNLHMLEDVFGWIAVLIGALVMKATDFVWIDPLLSIGVSVFVLINACRNIKEIFDLFLEKVPRNVDINEIKEKLRRVDGIVDVHHLHLWSMDGINHYATMHVVTNHAPYEIKAAVRKLLQEYNILHITIETETRNEPCHERDCHPIMHTHTEVNHHHCGHRH